MGQEKVPGIKNTPDITPEERDLMATREGNDKVAVIAGAVEGKDYKSVLEEQAIKEDQERDKNKKMPLEGVGGVKDN